MVLKLNNSSESPGGLVKQLAVAYTQFVVLLSLGLGPKIGISNSSQVMLMFLVLRPYFENH